MSEQFIQTLQRARVKRTILSPTRRNNPNPLGLVYQSPLHPNGTHLAIWNHEPSFRQTISRFPEITAHLGMVNFSSGKLQSVWPNDRQREPPVIKHSLKSTNRFSYQNPNNYQGLAYAPGKLKGLSCRPTDGPARGIVPRSFPMTFEAEKKEETITAKFP